MAKRLSFLCVATSLLCTHDNFTSLSKVVSYADLVAKHHLREEILFSFQSRLPVNSHICIRGMTRIRPLCINALSLFGVMFLNVILVSRAVFSVTAAIVRGNVTH